MSETPLGEAVDLQEAIVGAGVSVANTPHPAEIVDSPLPHRRYAVAVTDDHGLQVEELNFDPQEITPNPYRVKGTRKVADLDSFIAELARRPMSAEGTLWGSAQSGVLTAIYNDHLDDLAGWRDDQLVLTLTEDEYWKKWHKISGEFYNQNDFGDVIEDLIRTVIEPDQAELLEVIDSIRASTSGEFESKIERSNGDLKIAYKQESNVTAGRSGQLEIPQTITLELRPWEGHPDTHIVQAKFRTRISGGRLSLGVKLEPTKPIIRTAWTTVTTAVTLDTSKPVYAVA